ncbi:MAG: PEGA domain-containing protein, partial [Candidatus Saccharimonadales bacterium]
MDFLDPSRIRRHRILLRFGYAITALGIIIGATIMLWQAYGYSVHNGQVIQDGMIFISSQPSGASIYMNGALNSATTNTRLTIPAGAYNFKLTLPGYRQWQHVIVNLGGQVVHYDYPFLFPTKLTSKQITTFTSAPEVASQSSSLQYLLVSSPDDFSTFQLYDLTNPTNPPVTLGLSSSVVTAYSGAQSWQVIGWADDNQHVLLEHI